MNIIDFLKQEILKSGMSITEISRKAGLSRPMIYHILKNEVSTISSDTIEAICDALKIDSSKIYVQNEAQPKTNTIVLFGRGEGRKEYEVSDEEMKALEVLIKTMKHDSSKDNF